jgi:[ribosomal protein S5]-alanine N-acetyltransferase
LCLAIVEKNSGKYIGWCGIDHRNDLVPNPVIFFSLKKAYWNQGFATEAASAVITFCFDDLGLQRIDGACATENIASIRVMEKNGMCYIGNDESGGIQFSISGEEYMNKRNYSAVLKAI